MAKLIINEGLGSMVQNQYYKDKEKDDLNSSRMNKKKSKFFKKFSFPSLSKRLK
jgi:hypothetical protein